MSIKLNFHFLVKTPIEFCFNFKKIHGCRQGLCFVVLCLFMTCGVQGQASIPCTLYQLQVVVPPFLFPMQLRNILEDLVCDNVHVFQ